MRQIEEDNTHDERLAELDHLVGLELNFDALLRRCEQLLQAFKLVDAKA